MTTMIPDLATLATLGGPTINVILPRFRGQSHYAAIAAVCDLNSNSIGLT